MVQRPLGHPLPVGVPKFHVKAAAHPLDRPVEAMGDLLHHGFMVHVRGMLAAHRGQAVRPGRDHDFVPTRIHHDGEGYGGGLRVEESG